MTVTKLFGKIPFLKPSSDSPVKNILSYSLALNTSSKTTIN